MSFLPSCRDASKHLSKALDSGRPLGMHVRLHLSLCDACRRVLAQFALIRHGAARAPETGDALSAEAKARLRRVMDEFELESAPPEIKKTSANS